MARTDLQLLLPELLRPPYPTLFCQLVGLQHFRLSLFTPARTSLLQHPSPIQETKDGQRPFAQISSPPSPALQVDPPSLLLPHQLQDEDWVSKEVLGQEWYDRDQQRVLGVRNRGGRMEEEERIDSRLEFLLGL